MLRPAVLVRSRMVAESADAATFATQIKDSVRVQDWYTFLVRVGKIWKIQTIRTLLLPPAFYGALDSLEASKAVSDSVAADARRMRLAIQPDTALAIYLRTHQRQLTKLARLFINETSIIAMDDRGRVRPAQARPLADEAEMTTSMRELQIGALYRVEAKSPCVFAKVGGVGHYQVGFYYADSGCRMPTMGPSEYMYVEKITPSWYIYKTD